MGIPQQVQDRADAADKAAEQIFGKQDEDVQGERPPIPPKEEGKKPVIPEEKTIEALNNRYRVLQGKYDAETRQARSEISRLNGVIDVLQKQVSDLNAKMAQAAEKPKEPEKPAAPVANFVPTEHLSADEIKRLDEEGLDSDVLGILGKAFVAAAAKNAPNDVLQKVETLEKQQKQSAEQQQKQAFDAYNRQIDNALPDFDAVNNDPRFIEWLSKPVSPYVQKTRHQALKEAHDAMDAGTVIRMFKDFKDRLKPKKKEPEIEPPSSVGADEGKIVKDGNSSKLSMERLAAKWTPEKIRAFYADVSRGAYRRTPEQVKKIETEIWQANLARQKT